MEERKAQEMEEFECMICMEIISIDQCFRTQPFRACFNSFCRRCISKYVQAKISNHTANIRCPLENCHAHILNPLSCKSLISKALFDIWCDLLCELAVRRLERCYCPNIACLELIIDECSTVSDVQNRKISCPNCKKKFCFGCSSSWQVGHRCSRGRNFLPQGNDWQRCPGCKNYVERRGGCNMITCRCGTVFCYFCGQGPCLCGGGPHGRRLSRLNQQPQRRRLQGRHPDGDGDEDFRLCSCLILIVISIIAVLIIFT